MIVIKRGDCLTCMDELDEGSIDALVSDPPYEIGFMSKDWDRAGGIATSKEYWDRVWRVLAPGGVVKVFGGTRTFHRMAVAMVRAGFKNISLEAWVYGCLSEDTDILTETGWKPGLSVKVGELVACWDQHTNTITMMPVQETHYGPFKGDMVKVGDKQLLTPNHRVYTMTQDNVWTAVEASSLKGPCLVPFVSDCKVDGDTVTPEHVDEQTIKDHLVLPLYATVSTKSYEGVVWCVTVPTGAFVARRKGLTFITGNSGFPKNFNIEKKLDQMNYQRRERAIKEALAAEGITSVVWSNDRK